MLSCRSEGIGSLLRPPYFVDARERVERGDLTAAEFKRIEDRAVDEALALQEAAGLDVVTDGEQRRYAFFGHLGWAPACWRREWDSCRIAMRDAIA